MGNGSVHSGYSSVKPKVSIHNESGQNNGFLNTKSTSVNVSDDNFNADNYSVLVYKNVGGKSIVKCKIFMESGRRQSQGKYFI